MKKLILFFGTATLCCVSLHAATLYVPSQYPNIQAGIDAAVEGDTVMVEPDTYTGAGNIEIEFRGKAVVLKSLSGADETIIDCGEGALGRGFYIHEGEDHATIIDGFQVLNGVHTLPGGSGGGIMCEGASPTVRNCIFSGCGGYNGGAVGCYYGAAPRFDSCVFSGNGAFYGGAVGGIDAFEIIEFVNCVFVENSGVFGSAVYGFALTFNNCTFYSNVGDTKHGTIEFYAGGVVMNNCIVAFNEEGCAVFNGDSSDAYLSCCDIYGNEGGDYVNVIALAQFENGNISEDPIFCAPYISNLFLASNSPCLRENNSCDVLIGAYDAGCETGVVCGDINGDELVNILDVTDLIECIYMGIGCPEPIVLADVNNDGNFNILDVTCLIGYLYMDGPPPMC